MLQADIIREHALKHYVEVARCKGRKKLTIVSGKVEQKLSSSNQIPENRMPNVCQALKGRKFREMAGLRWLNPKEYKVSAFTRFHYEIKNISPSSGEDPTTGANPR